MAALRIAAQHLDALPRPDLAAFAVHCMRAGLPEQAAMAASRAPEELTALVAALQGNPDKVPSALEAAGGLTMALTLDALPSIVQSLQKLCLDDIACEHWLCVRGPFQHETMGSFVLLDLGECACHRTGGAVGHLYASLADWEPPGCRGRMEPGTEHCCRAGAESRTIEETGTA